MHKGSIFENEIIEEMENDEKNVLCSRRKRRRCGERVMRQKREGCVNVETSFYGRVESGKGGGVLDHQCELKITLADCT